MMYFMIYLAVSSVSAELHSTGKHLNRLIFFLPLSFLDGGQKGGAIVIMTVVSLNNYTATEPYVCFKNI